MIVDIRGQKFYMADKITAALDVYKKAIINDWDFCLIVDGVVGSGKSVLSFQIALYLDPTFNINRIIFEPDDLKNVINSMQKGQALVLDEAILGLSAKDHATFLQKELVKLLSICRQKNLFLILALPSFFDLDRNVAIHRTRALLHVYDNKFERGHVGFFDREKKKYLYAKGKKFYSYAWPKYNFYTRFSGHYTIDEQAYRKLKEEHLMKRLDAQADKEMNRLSKKDHTIFFALNWIRKFVKEEGIDLYRELEKEGLDVPRRSFNRYLQGNNRFLGQVGGNHNTSNREKGEELGSDSENKANLNQSVNRMMEINRETDIEDGEENE